MNQNLNFEYPESLKKYSDKIMKTTINHLPWNALFVENVDLIKLGFRWKIRNQNQNILNCDGYINGKLYDVHKTFDRNSEITVYFVKEERSNPKLYFEEFEVK